jgi:hypothetical protein
MTELLTFKMNNRQINLYHNRTERGAFQVFTLKNTENNTTAELWVEMECDYFEWQDWDKGFFTKDEEQKMSFSGEYFTEEIGREMMEYLQEEFTDLFPMFA